MSKFDGVSLATFFDAAGYWDKPLKKIIERNLPIRVAPEFSADLIFKSHEVALDHRQGYHVKT